MVAAVFLQFLWCNWGNFDLELSHDIFIAISLVTCLSYLFYRQYIFFFHRATHNLFMLVNKHVKQTVPVESTTEQLHKVRKKIINFSIICNVVGLVMLYNPRKWKNSFHNTTPRVTSTGTLKLVVIYWKSRKNMLKSETKDFLMKTLLPINFYFCSEFKFFAFLELCLLIS